MDMGTKIREMRVKRGLTQDELAGLLNITPQAISRWECGISLPDITMLPVLSKTLSVTTDELLGCNSSVNTLYDSCDDLAIFGEVLGQDQIDKIFEDRERTADGTPKKVLVVDDSDFMRMMLKDMLTKSGHLVIEAKDVESAAILLEKSEVDIVILDINMPGRNGIDFLGADQLRGKTVIMLSALCCESVVKKAYEKQAYAFVAKPFQAESIIKRV